MKSIRGLILKFWFWSSIRIFFIISSVSWMCPVWRKYLSRAVAVIGHSAKTCLTDTVVDKQNGQSGIGLFSIRC